MGDDDNTSEDAGQTTETGGTDDAAVAAQAAADKAAAEQADLGKTDAEKVAEAQAAEDKKTADAKAATDKEATDKADKEAADKEDADKKANKEAYGEVTGVQAVDDVAQILADKDIPAADAQALFAEAYESRDLSKIDQVKLVKMVGEGTARMIMTSLSEGITTQDTARTEMIESIHEAAGGKEAFDAAVEWMNGLTEGDFFDQQQEVRDLINGGGMGATMATANLIASFKSSSDFTETADLIAATGGKTDGVADYISRTDYANALRAATSDAQVAALDARRQRSMKQEAARRG